MESHNDRMLGQASREQGHRNTAAVSHGIAAELALMEVLRAARALLAVQDRSHALARASQCSPPSLTDAIERDFLTFDLQDASQVLREAVAAADALGSPRG